MNPISKLLHNRTANNAVWLIVGKIVQSIIAFIISMLTARYLGPSNYGIINYAASIVTFFVPIMQLGFNGVLVEQITNHPDEEGKIIGSSVLLSAISSLLCIFGVFCFTMIANPNETVTQVVCLLYSIMLFFQAFELIQYWYQAKLKSKFFSVVSLISYSIVASYKFILLYFKFDIYWFAVSHAIDYFIISILLFLIYMKIGNGKIGFSWEISKRIFKKSKYYILSGLMITIYGQTDKIMIKLMIGDEFTGYYSAAITTAGVISFVYAAIIDSMRPTIFKYKKEDNIEGFEKNVVRLYSIVIYLSLLQSILMCVFASFIISILYGSSYSPAIIVLQVIVWYSTFSYFGGAKDIWILSEGKQKYSAILNCVGALMNILLNLLFIPFLGIVGAAVASLITQIFTNVILLFIFRPLRRNFFLFLKAFNPMVLVHTFK